MRLEQQQKRSVKGRMCLRCGMKVSPKTRFVPPPHTLTTVQTCLHPLTPVHTRSRSDSQQEEIRQRAAAETEVLRLELLRRCGQE